MTERIGDSVYPTVSVDISYGEKVRDFSVDVEHITEYLVDRGLSDEQISELSIHFSPNRLGASVKNEPSRQILGLFTEEGSRIDVYKHEPWFSFYASQEGIGDYSSDVDKFTSKKLSSTLIHELEHYIQTLDERMMTDEEVYDKWRLRQVKRRLADTTMKYMGVGGVIYMSNHFATQAVHDSQESLGDVVYGSGLLAIGVSTIGAMIMSARSFNREGRELAKASGDEWYEHRPTEVAARHAEDEHKHPLVSIDTTPVVFKRITKAMTKTEKYVTGESISDLRISWPDLSHLD